MLPAHHSAAPAVSRRDGGMAGGGTRVQAVDAPGGSVVADPLRECRAVFIVDVHPARTLSVQEAVRDELNSKLMRYVPPLPLRAKPQAP